MTSNGQTRSCAICRSPTPAGDYATCSLNCHEKLITQLEAEFGEHKKIIGPDGIARRVPVRRIIEQGLRGDELESFPEW